MIKILLLIVSKLAVLLFIKEIHYVDKKQTIEIPGILKLALVLVLLPIDYLFVKYMQLPLIYALDSWMVLFSLSMMRSSYPMLVVYAVFRLLSLAGLLLYYFLVDYNLDVFLYLLKSDINSIYDFYPIIHPVYFVLGGIGFYQFVQVFCGKILLNDKHHIKNYGYFLDSIKRKRGLQRVIYHKEKPTRSTVENGIETLFYPLLYLQNKLMAYYLKPAIYFWNKPYKKKQYTKTKESELEKQLKEKLPYTQIEVIEDERI